MIGSLDVQDLSRRSVLTALGALLIAGRAGSAYAGDFNIQYSDAELMEALRNSYWVRGRDVPGRHAYVMVAPWCPYCKEAYPILRSIEDIEFRFIPTGGRSPIDKELIAYTILSQSITGLDLMYVNRRSPERIGGAEHGDFLVGVNEALEIALNTSFRARSGGGYGYPCLIFRSGQGVSVMPGMDRAKLKEQLEAVQRETPAAPSGSALASFLTSPPVFQRLSGSLRSAKRNGTDLYVAPKASAARLASIERGATFPALAETVVDRERWVVLEIFRSRRPHAYARAGDFA